jgi:hypothetical protein
MSRLDTYILRGFAWVLLAVIYWPITAAVLAAFFLGGLVLR